METATSTDMQLAGRRYRRVVLLADDPQGLEALDLALRRLAADVREVVVWLKVERFRAPSGTSLPYRAMAITEARNITNERIAAAEAEGRRVVATWDGRQTQVAAMADLTPEALAGRLMSEKIDLIVSHGDGPDVLAAPAAAHAGCPLLLVPTHGPTADSALTSVGSRRQRAGGLIPTFHR